MRVISLFGMVSAAALLAAAPALADPPGPQPWPVADGHYTSTGDPGWIYFLSPQGYGGARDGVAVAQFGCGIGPGGTVGCDVVPDPVQIGDAPATVVPTGANQTIASAQEAGRYVHSDRLTFTRDVDVLPAGHELVNGGASCQVGYQGSVTCQVGDHGFTNYNISGTTH